MAKTKVLISIDQTLLRKIDARVAQLGTSRSAFLADIARERVEGRPKKSEAELRAIDERLERVREMVRRSTDTSPHETTTQYLRRMRDER